MFFKVPNVFYNILRFTILLQFSIYVCYVPVKSSLTHSLTHCLRLYLLEDSCKSLRECQCTAFASMCTVDDSVSSLGQLDTPGAGLSSIQRAASASARPPRPRRRRSRRGAAVGRGALTTMASPTVVGGGGVLKEEPVQFPVTIHSSAAYFVTKIKLYSTFSIYFRVSNSIAVNR